LFEYYIALGIYAQTGKSINKLTYNFAHNLGNIYDMTEEGIVRSTKIKQVYDDADYWGRMGTIVGTNFQSIFEDPVNYYPYGYEDPNYYQER
jgi:putative heme iron utilization protein